MYVAKLLKEKHDHLKSIIKINRGIAAGLRGKAQQAECARLATREATVTADA